jgi:hypothetical protein
VIICLHVRFLNPRIGRHIATALRQECFGAGIFQSPPSGALPRQFSSRCLQYSEEWTSSNMLMRIYSSCYLGNRLIDPERCCIPSNIISSPFSPMTALFRLACIWLILHDRSDHHHSSASSSTPAHLLTSSTSHPPPDPSS